MLGLVGKPEGRKPLAGTKYDMTTNQHDAKYSCE
jgi:hypothetical protein